MRQTAKQTKVTSVPKAPTTYITTGGSCTCPARKFKPSMPCKHMIQWNDEAIAQAEADRQAWLNWQILLNHFHTTATDCTCRDFINEDTDCCIHMAYVQQLQGQELDNAA